MWETGGRWFARILDAPVYVEVTGVTLGTGDLHPGDLVAPGAPAIELGQQAFERVLGVRPLLVRSGGTLPIVPALERKGIPTVVTGFSIPGANVHAPNERLLLEYLPVGIECAKELFRSWAAL